jgi:SAM-dependent methyltransferase
MKSHSIARAITEATVPFLLSERGRAAAKELHQTDLRETNTLALLTALRRSFSAEEAGALLALAQLRQRGIEKFPFADQLFFTAEALEQATAWPVAEHRAAWIDQLAPAGPILDLGCGIGGDTLALAPRRCVIAIDLDPVRLRLAAANVAARGLATQVTLQQADWTARLAQQQLPAAAAAFADPSRRVDERRVFSLYQMQPPLAAILRLQQAIPHLGVKVMPGVADAELPATCGIEFVSHQGICKEAVLWFGDLAQGGRRWASVHTPQGWHTLVASGDPPPLGALAPGHCLHEPDPAVIRAGALWEVCEQLNAHLFDTQIAYLVSTHVQPSPFVQSFAIQELHPFSLKLLNRRLQALRIGTVELKKRGFPTEPEALRPRLKLYPGGQAAVVIFTRRGHERLMMIGTRVDQKRNA